MLGKPLKLKLKAERDSRLKTQESRVKIGIGWEHRNRKQKFRTFLFCGSDSGQFDCGERYSKRKRTIGKREQKHTYTYTNPIFQHVFVIFCERVCKNYFCYL
jgi:hypothetical protein